MKHQQSTTDTVSAVPPKTALHTASTSDGAIQLQSFPPSDSRDDTTRQLAYSFYVERGYLDGHDLEDWLEAETQVDQLLTKNAQSLASTSSSH